LYRTISAVTGKPKFTKKKKAASGSDETLKTELEIMKSIGESLKQCNEGEQLIKPKDEDDYSVSCWPNN